MRIFRSEKFKSYLTSEFFIFYLEILILQVNLCTELIFEILFQYIGLRIHKNMFENEGNFLQVPVK